LTLVFTYIGKAYSSGHAEVIWVWALSPLFTKQELQNMLKSIVIAGSLLALSTLPSLAGTKTSCDAIDKAVSANEDFVEIVLGTDASARADAQKAVRDNFALVSASLAPDVAEKSKAAMAKLDSAFAAGEMSEASLAAMENYTVLVKAFDQRLPTTTEVAMLDHAGFKLHALLAAKTVNWAAIGETVANTEVHLKAASEQIKDKAVKDILATISSGLTEAQKAQDSAWEHHSAQMLLDSVDLIERTVKNTSKQACS
jgi:hypothetical protein